MVPVWLRYDLRSPENCTPSDVQFRVALEQVAWADKASFDVVLLPEHHCTEDGYNPSPFVLAAAMAGLTERIRFNIGAVLLPLHNPLRLAEDAVVLDNISHGRVELTAGVGYVQSEFDMFGRQMSDRAQLADEGLTVLRSAFTGDPFSYRDRPVRVTPRPVQKPGPPIYVGGAVAASARRAARLGDGFFPTVHSDQLVQVYRDECSRIGRPVGHVVNINGPVFIHVADDPDRAWAQIAPHALNEVNMYARWKAEATATDTPFIEVDNVDELKNTGLYRVVTPDECLELAKSQGEVGAHLTFTPLLSGLDPDLSWQSLELFAEKVAPRLCTL